jgi:exodeoxyribonuclease VII large subunit
LNRIKKVLHHFDIVVIVRGGGGEVGMTCYNNYELCKAIATFPMPVLTGIGHSTNLTVAEMISFRNAITPTELGEFLIQSFHEFAVPVQDARKSIRLSSLKLLEATRGDFANEIKHFRNAAKLYLNRSDQLLQNASRTLQGKARMLLVQNKEVVHSSLNELKVSGVRLLKDQQLELHRSQEDLSNESSRIIERSDQELSNLTNMVRLLDPRNVLKRGFSITTIHGKTVKPGLDLTSGTLIETSTFDFIITSEIKKIDKNEHGD